jgi:16S rRNA (guanine527-N7)-methyltransferase
MIEKLLYILLLSVLQIQQGNAFISIDVHNWSPSIQQHDINKEHGRRCRHHLSKQSLKSEQASDSIDSREHLLSLDPDSKEAQQIVLDDLQQSEETLSKLRKLSYLVTEWNNRINLVSRQDCSTSTVFGRHVLPSAAVTQLKGDDGEPFLRRAKRVVDVGTGGGFPGLPLAILYPETSFLLLDSVGKKLTACADMAERLGLRNVKTHHGRSEELIDSKFDIVTGRSVTSVPQFCAWVQHLLTDDGHLLYWIGGGDIPPNALEVVQQDVPLSELVPVLQSSDKRILVFPATAVRKIAKESGLLPTRKVTKNSTSNKTKNKPQRTPKTKGEWRKKSSDEPKQRGYESFKRYSSSPRNSSSNGD